MKEQKFNLPVELERCIYLRDVTWPKVIERLERGHLRLIVYRSECGTYACILGEFAMSERAVADRWEWSPIGPKWTMGGRPLGPNGRRIVRHDIEYFGLSFEQLWGVRGIFSPGPNTRAELDRRYAILCAHIEEKLKELAIT